MSESPAPPELLTAREWCDRFYAGLPFLRQRYPDLPVESVRLAVEKSCLLDRLVYGGEKPSQTPCPVHKGVWSGISLWPGHTWRYIDGRPDQPVEVDSVRQRWYDDGCRCWQHKCGCTTGWQPDEHCGCKLPDAP